jgi:hypothetical protein
LSRQKKKTHLLRVFERNRLFVRWD